MAAFDDVDGSWDEVLHAVLGAHGQVPQAAVAAAAAGPGTLPARRTFAAALRRVRRAMRLMRRARNAGRAHDGDGVRSLAQLTGGDALERGADEAPAPPGQRCFEPGHGAHCGRCTTAPTLRDEALFEVSAAVRSRRVHRRAPLSWWREAAPGPAAPFLPLTRARRAAAAGRRPGPQERRKGARLRGPRRRAGRARGG